MTTIGLALRVTAIAIAVLGAIDPAFTWTISDRPVVALIDADAGAGGASFTTDISRALAREYTVHPGPVAGAAATVVLGHRVPQVEPLPVGALVSMVPPSAPVRIAIEHLSSPARASVSSRVPIRVGIRAVGLSGRSVRADVLSSQLVLDRATHAVTRDDERFELMLFAAPPDLGLARLHVRVDVVDGNAARVAAEADLGVEIDEHRWPVLIVDGRPSWMSTFVRRALEADRRFDVVSRVATSRGVDVESGAAPPLSDRASLDRFAAVVIGAPDALDDPDVRALEAFARRRGGALILLMDRLASGPFARLTGVPGWTDVHGETRFTMSAGTDTGAFVATELAVPQTLDPGADVLAAERSGKTPQTVVWQTPLGAGLVVVNGALDSWRYRARDTGGFARFWTRTIAAAADVAPPPLTLELGARVLSAAPAEAGGTLVPVRVVVRDVQLSDPQISAPPVSVRARLERREPVDAGATPVFVRLLPESERGVFTGAVRVPVPGAYRVVVEADQGQVRRPGDQAALRTTAELYVGRPVADPYVGRPGLQAAAPNIAELSAWTTAHGGVVVAPSADATRSVSALVTALDTRVVVAARPARVYPMRSLWWLPVFVLMLGGEWWIRRRRGER